MTTAETTARQAHDNLLTLWNLVSIKLHSTMASNEHDQQALHARIIDLIEFIQETYFVSNRTINHILHLAETKNHFNNYFNTIFKIDEIVYNYEYKKGMCVTIN